MVITLTGDNFGIHQTLSQLAERFVAKFGPHSYERVDGETFEPSNLASLLQGASLFTPQRLVVLKDGSKNKPLWDALGDWVEKVPDGVTLVVVEADLDKRTKTYKALKSKTEFKEFIPVSNAELVKWLQAEAKKLGAEVKPADAQYLVERTGGDQWRLSQEVMKLANHKDGITRQTIEELVEPSPEGSAFELLDAALDGNAEKVQKLIDSLKSEEDPYKLFGLLTSQIHTLAVVAAAGDRSADQVAKDSGLHPFVVRKTVPAAKRLGAKRIAEIVEQVANCDVQLKSTGADPWFLLSVMFQKLAYKD
jgi:DNA polymerase III delta subunit